MRILVPVDFLPQSVIALEQSYNLARLYDAIIHLVYVVEPPGKLASAVGINSAQKHEERLEAARQRVNDLAAHIRATIKVAVQTTTTSGNVAECIRAEARKLNASFIVLAASQKTGVKRLLHESVAWAVVSQAPCPVITVRGQEHRNWCHNLLLPLDLSKNTTQKVGKAIELAQMFDGSTIHVLSVAEAADHDTAVKLKAQLNEVAEQVDAAELECVTHLVAHEGRTVADTILEQARTIKADLIAVMIRAEDRGTRFFVGSEAERIIQRSEIPVLSMVPQK